MAVNFLTIWTLLIISAAASSTSPLTCNVSRQHDGSFLYHLSRPPSSAQCETCWEDQNKTVLARNARSHPELVRNLTNQSLILKDCSDYLHYTQSCNGVWEDAHCTINCSHILVYPPLATVNSTLNCIVENWCPTPLEVGLGATGIVILGLVVLVYLAVQRWNICKCRRASYTPANVQMITQEDMVVVDIKA